MKRKSYSPEFKKQTVRLILVEGQPVKFVAKTLGIHENSIYRWVFEYEKFGDEAFPGRGSRNFVKQSMIKKLEKENELLKKY